MFCGAVFLDLTKTFDTVDHNIMLLKLSAIGVSHITLDWFKPYLTNRKRETSCGILWHDTKPNQDRFVFAISVK